MLRIALAQMNATVGDLKGNADRVLDFARRAHAQGADAVCFPELTLSGYPPEDLVFRHGFVEENNRQLARVVAEAPPMVLVVGHLEPSGQARPWNSAALIHDNRILANHRKNKLPNYGVFDEERHFLAGEQCEVVEVLGTRISMAICEDLWHADGPSARAARAGARLVLSPNASPFSVGKRELRERVMCRRALESGVHLVYVNWVAGQDELVFDGSSFVASPDGTLDCRGPQFEEALILVDLPLGESPGGERSPVQAPFTLHDPRSVEEEVYGALVLATRDYVRKNGFKEVLLGLSGGVDSSLVAAVAADALGPERVLGVMMPSRYSSEGSLSDAQALAKALRIRTELVPIEPAHAALLGSLEPLLGEGAHGTTEENLQSRIRGILLMALSNARGALVLPTGNKSEMAVGYATLYGDMAGGFAILKDVEKQLVFRLCRWLNKQVDKDRIPRWVIEKPPSAELRPGQRDTDSLPPYDVLDPILRAYVEEDCTVAEIVEQGFDAAVVRLVAGMVDRAEYKRRQSAPGPRITERGFGKDRRMPITSKYHDP